MPYESGSFRKLQIMLQRRCGCNIPDDAAFRASSKILSVIDLKMQHCIQHDRKAVIVHTDVINFRYYENNPPESDRDDQGSMGLNFHLTGKPPCLQHRESEVPAPRW